MVNPNDIIVAINKLLVGKYPDDHVYINLLPKDFERPSFFIEQVSAVRTDANKTTVAWIVDVSITCFINIDGHYNSDVETLVDKQSGVAGLFDCGYLAVGDRCIAVNSVTGGNDAATSFVDLQFDYFDARPVYGEQLPAMEIIQTIITQEG